MPAGKRFGDSRAGDSGYGTRRAFYGVVAWILILLAIFWLLAEWQTLPARAASLLSVVR